ncbi:MAG: carboxypeptidase-like regulatory domain-containing protein [Acidobacteriia bacterium]|nr:carboxypeptidase-like regulatory domain-containing protein [Terriglobia bacterium]
MKITLAAARSAIMAAVFLCLMVGSATASNDPIPGIDIVVKRHPSGKAIQARTDNGGRFVFDNLEAGQYILSVNPPQTKTLVNTSHSNIRRPGISMLNGVQVVNVSVELGAEPASVEIEITKSGGKIAGVVTRATAPAGGGATPAQQTPKKAK